MQQQRREQSQKRKSQKKKSQRIKDRSGRKGRTVAKRCVFPCFFPLICGSGGLKSRLAKAVGAEPSGQVREINKSTPLWADFEVKCTKHFRHGALCDAKQMSKST